MDDLRSRTLGFRVYGLGFWFLGLGFWVLGLGFVFCLQPSRKKGVG